MKNKNIQLDQEYKLIDSIEHQGIGGQKIILEREVSLYDLFEMNTIAAMNFIKRRPDLARIGIFTQDDIEQIMNGQKTSEQINNDYDKQLKDLKVYYGHIGFLGYFVSPDEIEEEVS